MKKYNIVRLDWDSDFFGYEVSSISIGYQSDFISLNSIRRDITKCKLCYVFSKTTILNDIDAFEDEKVVFEKLIDIEGTRQSNERTEAKESDFDSLLKLALISGEYSRFRLDTRFINREFERLYETWLIKSINLEIADMVYLIQYHGINVGFITLKKKDSSVMEIGLIATAEDARGKGIGSRLISAGVEFAILNQCDIMRVSTQRRNIGAMNFYIKNGFKEVGCTYIYHLWK